MYFFNNNKMVKPVPLTIQKINFDYIVEFVKKHVNVSVMIHCIN